MADLTTEQKTALRSKVFADTEIQAIVTAAGWDKVRAELDRIAIERRRSQADTGLGTAVNLNSTGDWDIIDVLLPTISPSVLMDTINELDQALEARQAAKVKRLLFVLWGAMRNQVKGGA
jgi:hypothetical protein